MSQILTICWFKLAKFLLVQLPWIILGSSFNLLHQIQACVLVKLLLFVCSFLEVLFTSGKDLQIAAGVNHSFPKSSHLTQVQVSPTKLGRAKLNFKFVSTEIKSSSILCIYFLVVGKMWTDLQGIGRQCPRWQPCEHKIALFVKSTALSPSSLLFEACPRDRSPSEDVCSRVISRFAGERLNRRHLL